MLRKLKGIIKKPQQLATADEAGEQEAGEAGVAASEGSEHLRVWSGNNTLFGDSGLGSVPVETPTASLQVRAAADARPSPEPTGAAESHHHHPPPPVTTHHPPPTTHHPPAGAHHQQLQAVAGAQPPVCLGSAGHRGLQRH
jgi:hypothetical protein